MSDAHTPEDMPTDGWKVKSFSHEKGLGALLHESTAEEVMFQVDAWNVGDWQPPRKEAALIGAASPILPREGEAVRVTWRRSVLGKIVPRVVEPTGRESTVKKEYKLAAWLKGIQRHAGKLAGLTAGKVVGALRKLDEDNADQWTDGEARDATDYHFLLMDLGNVRDVDEPWARTHCAWIYTDDHRWDRDRARETVCTVLGLVAGEVLPAGDDESLPQYVARCNAAARSKGAKEFLYEVALDGDAHVFIAVTPAAIRVLQEGGYVESDA